MGHILVRDAQHTAHTHHTRQTGATTTDDPGPPHSARPPHNHVTTAPIALRTRVPETTVDARHGIAAVLLIARREDHTIIGHRARVYV